MCKTFAIYVIYVIFTCDIFDKHLYGKKKISTGFIQLVIFLSLTLIKQMYLFLLNASVIKIFQELRKVDFDDKDKHIINRSGS